eukprot:CAMPEP_0172696626 /NCGR_PEP_ID=MMETSP1074-20121228/28190_1 /TAXON_ID=2916 /ORGANISM="Ceratium fusus, Strain PA161109" /LENGTH=120 /DNA_ID=CAMNT_0013517401 /DNA_START=127 /DNA_END=490 /DNA_ORIENTATION=-
MTSMRGFDGTPRGIGLKQNAVTWQLLDNFKVLGRLQGTAVDTNVKAHLDESLRILQASIKAVHHAREVDGSRALCFASNSKRSVAASEVRQCKNSGKPSGAANSVIWTSKYCNCTSLEQN